MGKVLSLLLPIALASPLCSEIIDRIVAVVDKHIITLSDVRAERALRGVFEEPAPDNDRELLDELIDQHLIHTQLDFAPDVDPTDDQIDTRLAEIQNYQGLPKQVVREAVRDHLRRELFVDSKFRQFTTATEKEAQDYYESVFLPAARNQGLNPIPKLQDVEPLIRGNVIEEKTAAKMKTWLQQMRKTTAVEILPEVRK